MFWQENSNEIFSSINENNEYLCQNLKQKLLEIFFVCLKQFSER